ncbi:MAG: hypothetical protein WC264_03040 [Candidatus Paceibacterota bacterium]|jgi:hypothetical protein
MKILYTHFLSEKQISERLGLLLKETALEHKNLILNLEENKLGKFNFIINKKAISGKSEIKGRDIEIYIKIQFFSFKLKRKIRKIISNKMHDVFYYDKEKEYKFATT